jgi:hypothetical protein
MTLFCMVAYLLILTPPAAAKTSQPTDRYSAEVAVAWLELLYDVVRAENLSPPVAARVYGIAGSVIQVMLCP